MEFLQTRLERCHQVSETLCRIQTIGKSYEGRDLKVFNIGNEPGKIKRSIWIDAGIHAREWISHATALFIIDRLVDEFGNDPEIDDMIRTYDWYILPIVNPDGYEFTWTNDRLWRKTRKPNPGSPCVGVDANRNFGFNWNSVGSSNDPCSPIYAGPSPWSEPEAKAIKDFMEQSTFNWILFITLHSKGQLWMAPWGYTTERPDNYDKLMEVGQLAIKAIKETHGKDYRLGSASEILYLSSGTSRDWAAGSANIPYVYTIELRDKGEFGWELPPEQIRPTGEEIWNAVKAVYKKIKSDNPSLI
ncbi:DgyrCDS6977 [Dimorphilus gyrociliatus]|nr:DgyrCDS6977 [Dimorphilus gyrociliatus]